MTFHCFPQFPKEIRLRIWELALPEPRLVELGLRNIVFPGWPISVNRWPGTRCVWTTIHPPPVLLEVSYEARNIALASYESTSIWCTSRKPWKRAYIDYARDTFYFSMGCFQALQDSLLGKFPSLRTSPIELASTRVLAIESRQANPWSDRPGSRNDGRDLEISAEYLASTFELFPALRELLLVINGRDPRFKGPDELVEPGEAFKDYYDEAGREMMIDRISVLVDEVRLNKAN